MTFSERQSQEAEMLQSDIRDLRARALKHGFIAGAEALSLAHEIIDLGAERQGREEGNVVQLHCATAPNVDLT